MQDQSNKVPANKARSLFPVNNKSSKMRLFCSLQMTHITQCSTKFQIFKECFPNQFLQPANKSITFLGKTQVTPTDLKAKLHNRETSPQCNRRWTTLSPATTQTEARPIHNSKALSPQIIIYKNLPPCSFQNKKWHSM